MKLRLVGVSLAVLVACAGSAGVSAQPPATTHIRWHCEVVYQPTRHVWSRQVDLRHDDKRLTEVLIDGVPVYRFSVWQHSIRTSLDNERVRLDVASMTWSSDFRGVATGEGRCELQED